jgi:hypothetical protein
MLEVISKGCEKKNQVLMVPIVIKIFNVDDICKL